MLQLLFFFIYRYIRYNPTSLERSYKFEILADHDLGLNIDLVNKDKYANDNSNYIMDIADEKLLEEDILAPQDSKRYNFTLNLILLPTQTILSKTKLVVCFIFMYLV